MFPSFKTMVCFAVVIALAAGVLFGRDAIPYAKTAVKQARQSVQDAVPTEFDLDRASMELGESDSELLEFRKRVAELEVDLEDRPVILVRGRAHHLSFHVSFHLS